MLVPDQLIIVVWNPTTKQHYEDLGYEFTKFGDEFLVTPQDLTPNSGAIVEVICDDCGKEMERSFSDYNRNIRRNGRYICKSCTTKNRNIKNDPDRVQRQMQKYYDFCERNGYIPLATIDDYVDNKTKLPYICPKHGRKTIDMVGIDRGHRCYDCGHEISPPNKYTPEQVKNIVENKNGDILLNPNSYVNVNTKNLEVICGSCGEKFITSLASIMNSNGACTKCGFEKSIKIKQNKLSPEEVEQRVNEINGNKLLNPQDYVSIGTANLQIQCGECGAIYTTSLANYLWNDKIRCGDCSQRISKLERRVMDFLDYYDIKYEREKRFSDCKDKKYLPFDFYLPDYNLLIETDGQGHYEPIFGEESFMRTLLHDGMKNNYCRWNNIELLRIPYFQGNQIEKILSEKLGVGNGCQKILYKTHNNQYYGDHNKKRA